MANLKSTDKNNELLLDIFFRGATAPTAFYMALLNDTLLGTDDWADVSANEVTAVNNPGYAQATINRDGTASGWPTLALDDGEMQIVSKKCSFTATSDWATDITAIACVADMATDHLCLFANISAASVKQGETVSWTIKYKLKKVA